MDMQKALKAGNLARKVEELEKAIKVLKSGYTDEWVIRNERIANKVELTSEHVKVLIEMFEKEKSEKEKELEQL